MGFMQLFKRSTFPHGVHPPENKDITSSLPIRRLSFPSQLILPVLQHFGAPAKPIVNKGDEVVRGQPIAKASGFMSVPLHAPATGVIEDIKLMHTTKGPKTLSILLKLHPSSDQQVLWEVPQEVDHMTQEQLLKAVQDTGMVGLGGAAFPTHVKFSVPQGHHVDTLLVNGCECEPFLTTDHRVMLENVDDILAGTRIAMKVVDAERAIIGIEDNKLDAAEAIRTQLPKDGPITVGIAQTKYPQGAEKMLIKALLNREVPAGGFPAHVGVVVQNVATLAQLGTLLPHGQGLIERVVTISGPGVLKPGNYMIALGTPLRHVLDEVGFSGSANQIILGGPMMGTNVASLDVPVTKAIGGILIFNEAVIEERPTQVYPCIKCGRCLEACPIHLNPSRLGLLAAKREYPVMEEQFNLNACFECGCCSYVCPSNIPLVQYFRIAKSINRERRA